MRGKLLHLTWGGLAEVSSARSSEENYESRGSKGADVKSSSKVWIICVYMWNTGKPREKGYDVERSRTESESLS